MKLILAQPANLRFQWELEVLLANIRQFTDMEVVLLFVERDFTVPMRFRKEPGCSVFVYGERDNARYIPSIRPYLLWQYLKEDPAREHEQYFYIDSDIIFREWPVLSVVSAESVQGASCDGYIGLDYILSCKHGEEIAHKMAEITGISLQQMRGIPGIGAQLILDSPTAAFWERSYRDSNTLYEYLESLGETTNIQKWTAEMWAQLWGWVRESKALMVNNELAFCLPTDPIEKFDEVKILHNAGVLATQSHELFWKGQYDKTSPLGKDFSWVRRDRASYRYVQALEKVVRLKQ